MNQHTVVAGYSATSSSTEAVLWASDEAVARKFDLRVIACYEIPVAGAIAGPWLATGAYDMIVDATTQPAVSIKKVLQDRHPDLKLDVQVSAGPASQALLDELTATDLLVVGSSSHEGAAAFWLGSTARSLARHSPCPVVVIRGAASRGRPDRIVVGVDGSKPSNAAVIWAADEADLHGRELTVVHSWQYPYLGPDITSSQAKDLTRVDAALVLEQSVELARERCGADVTGVLVEGSPASGLLGAVSDGDLLVMGSSGRGAIASGLLGSTVNFVLDEAAVPVVVVRATSGEKHDESS